MTASARASRRGTTPDRSLAAKQWLFGVYLVSLGILLLVLLLRVFPGRVDQQTLNLTTVIDFFDGWIVLELQPEIRLLALAVVAGALGAYVHLATSFADFVGTRTLKESWFWWYVLRPFIGATLAVIVYGALRGGLAGVSEADDISPYGVVAIGALSGLFSPPGDR